MVVKTRNGTRAQRSMFPHLPPELCQEIWLDVIYSPSIIEIKLHQRTAAWLTPQDKTIAVPVRNSKHVALNTCRESRRIALREYKILFIENPKFEYYEDRRDKDYQLFFNCHSDILYLRMKGLTWPNFRFRDLGEDFYLCLRYLKLDTRWLMDSFDRQTQVGNIHSVLREIQKFSGLESLILQGCTKKIVQDALKEILQGRQEPTEWRITRISGSTSMSLLCTIKYIY
jgi:hypothetical protein